MKKILIVEDDAILLSTLVDNLSHEKKFEIVTAKDGEEALETALREHPDLILLDILLRRLNN